MEPLEQDPFTPIETDFFVSALKYLEREVAMREQVEVQTPHGSFRLDFLLEHNTHDRNGKLGVELDGRDYHVDELRDLWRDAAILESGVVRAIYRIPGRSIRNCAPEAWELLRRMEPWLVPAPSVEVLRRQVNPLMHNHESTWVAPHGGVAFLDLWQDALDPESAAERTAEIGPRTATVIVDRHAPDLADVADAMKWLASNPGLPLDEVIDRAIRESPYWGRQAEGRTLRQPTTPERRRKRPPFPNQE